MLEPEAHGNPAPGSNPLITLDFDTAIAGSQGIEVTDADLFPSPLIIAAGQSFNVATEFILAGIWSTSWFHTHHIQFDINYYAEPMTGGGPNEHLGTIVMFTDNVAAVVHVVPPSVSYNVPLTRVAVAKNPLSPGLYRLTATASFSSAPCPWPLNAYITGPVLEVY
ncbi:MAG TPA: hypothetical protein VKR83_09830 [Ktedonobacteraceae bacterium]|nr:hypothetical protein [Ktedonobacteraceae bacterium]